MKKYMVTLLLAFTGKLYSQNFDRVSCDTCPPYITPLVYYNKGLNPSLWYHQMENHLEFTTSLRSPMLYPQFVSLDTNLQVLELDAGCIQKLPIPDFAPKFISYYWNEKEKCFVGVKSSKWQQNRSYSSPTTPPAVKVEGSVKPCAGTPKNKTKQEEQSVANADPRLNRKEYVTVGLNAAHNCCSVSFFAKVSGKLNLEFLNIFGESIKIVAIPDGANYATFEVNDLPNGMYMWRLRDKVKSIGSGTVIIQR